MKVTLEKADLLRILSSALGYPIDEEDVEVRADPFEVHIRSVNVDELAQQQKSEPITPADIPDIPEEPSEKTQTTANTVMTMADILRRNETMGGAPVSRPLGPEESEDPPPISEAELMSAWRYND